MKIKQKLALILSFSILSLNFMPLASYAINDKTSHKSRKEIKAEKSRDVRLGYINMDWWNNYNDPYLTDYIQKAFDCNQDLKVVTLRVEEARQAAKAQLASELPSLSAGISPLLYKMPGVQNTEGIFSIPVIASYELDLFLKNHDKTKSSKKTYEASKYQEKASYISVAGAVGSTYYNIVKLDEIIRLQKQIIADRTKIYELMKECNDAGLISTADLIQADKARVYAAAELINYQKSLEIMLNSLAVLIGDSPDNTSDYKRISYSKLNYKNAVPEEISSDIITSRPDYMAAEKMVEKAGIDVRIAKKEFLPTINIVGLLNFASGSELPSMSWNSSLAALAGSAMLPIFTGGKRLAYLHIQKNRYEQALQQYYKTNLTAIQEVNDALSNLKLDNEKYQKNLKTLSMEQKDFGYSQAKYKEGTISYLDLLQKKENMLDVQKLVAASKIDCYVNQISLYKAVAGANL